MYDCFFTSAPQLKRDPLGAPLQGSSDTATKVVKVLFFVAGLLFLVGGLVPALKGHEINTSSLSTAVVFLLLAVGLKARRPPTASPPPGGA